MIDEIPEAGSANAEIRALVHSVWIETLQSRTLDVTGFDPNSALSDRLAWATAHGFLIGGVLSRFSSKLQQSTSAQVRENVVFAGSHRIYVPPEFVCVDEAVSGRKSRRDGLTRMTKLLKAKLVRVLLVFKVSRLFRVAYLGFKFFQEEIVEEDLRAISTSQGIDTADTKSWKHLAYLHGIMDEMLVGAIADHVRSGLADMFQRGYVTGGITIGYEGVEVPGAPLTKLGRPRRMPAVSKDTSKLIAEHFQLIRDGMPIRQGWKRWVAAGGPSDSRSAGHMSYNAYRRMMSNQRYIGIWAFGRKRNQWSNKRDCNRTVDQPEAEVIVVRSEELRIISDDLFFAVQQRLAKLKRGPRGPKRRRQLNLWDLVTDCFICHACSNGPDSFRFYQAGANGRGMRCKRGNLCPCLTIVRRQEAVRAVCDKLTELLARDTEIITAVIARARDINAQGDEAITDQLAQLDRKIAALGRKISDLSDLAGNGTDEDRADLKAKVRAAQLERTSKQAERSTLQATIVSESTVVTPEDVRKLLTDLALLLEAGAAGKLGEDMVYRAADIFRQLVGGRISVHVHTRPGRKRTAVVGTFSPLLLKTAAGQLEAVDSSSAATEEVQVWLREPPRVDVLAPRAHELIDLKNLSFRDAAKVLQAEGHKINSGVLYQLYARYYQMIGKPMPKRPYNNGRPRRPKHGSAL